MEIFIDYTQKNLILRVFQNSGNISTAVLMVVFCFRLADYFHNLSVDKAFRDDVQFHW